MIKVNGDLKKRNANLIKYIKVVRGINPFKLEYVDYMENKLIFTLIDKRIINILITELPQNALADFNRIKKQIKNFNSLKDYLKINMKNIEDNIYEHFYYLNNFNFRIFKSKIMIYDFEVHYKGITKLRHFDFSMLNLNNYFNGEKIKEDNLISLFIHIITNLLKEIIPSTKEEGIEELKKELITKINNDIVSRLKIIYPDIYNITMRTNCINFASETNNYYFENMDSNILFNPDLFQFEEIYFNEIKYSKLVPKFTKEDYLAHIDYCMGYVVDFINNNKVSVVNFEGYRELIKKIESICEDYNAEAIPWLNGYSPLKFRNHFLSSFNDINIVYSKQHFGMAIYNIKTKEFKFELDEEYKDLFRMKKSKKYQKCKRFVLKLMNKFEFEIKSLNNDRHYYLLKGNAKLALTKNKEIYKDFKIQEMIEIPSYSEDIVEWKRNVGNLFNKWNNIFNNYAKNEICSIHRENKEFVGNFLVCDILNFIEINPQGLSESTIHQGLRGLISNPNVTKLTKNCGKYNLYDKTDIKKTIRRLLEKEIIISEKTKSIYGYYYNLFLNKGMHFKYFEEQNINLNYINNKIENDLELTDFECAFLFDKLKGKSEIGDYIKIFNLLKNYNFSMVYMNELILYFKKSPDVIKQYINIKIDIENDIILKKIYVKLFEN